MKNQTITIDADTTEAPAQLRQAPSRRIRISRTVRVQGTASFCALRSAIADAGHEAVLVTSAGQGWSV